MNYIVSYDISDDKRRLKINKLITKAGGTRIQYSVYLIKLKYVHLKALLSTIKDHVNFSKSDTVYVWNIDQKNIPLHIDNSRLKWYLSDEIEDIFL